MTLLDSVNKRLRRFNIQIWSKKGLIKQWQRFMSGYGRRSPAYAGEIDQDYAVSHEWDYTVLVRQLDNHPVFRKIHEGYRRELFKNGGQVQPLFKKKCSSCNMKFQEENIEKCDQCGSTDFIEPDAEQKLKLDAFVKTPNRDDEWMDLIGSWLRFILSCDDWYWSIYQTKSVIPALSEDGDSFETFPIQIFVEDSRYIWIESNIYGRLGSQVWFCPNCYNPEHDSPKYDKNMTLKLSRVCPICHGSLEETAYTWRESMGSTVKGRFSRYNMVHGKWHSQLPHLYGLSLMLACLRAGYIVTHMDRFQLENYARGKVSKLYVAFGITQERMNQVQSDIGKQKDEKREKSLLTGQRGAPKIHNPMIGFENPETRMEAFDAMPDPDKMQSLDWSREQIERICGIYGVTPKFTGIAEAGKAGVLEKVDVDDEAVRTVMTMFEQKWEENLWPKLGITDWAWRFDEIEKRDELLDARVMDMNVRTVITAVNSGMEGEIKEDGTIRIYGKPTPGSQIPQDATHFMSPVQRLTNPEENAMELKSEQYSEDDSVWIVKRKVKPSAEGSS